ncbi:MAG: ABC transporter substrate-binding protein [Chloroflexi bacterium]|nr:ABC transporter substrate-binding protein [Chloroflexota bacterium]
MKLRYAGALYDRTLALYTGEVRPEGVELDYTVGHPNQIFRRMLASAEFDVSEMSAANYLCAVARGDRRFVAIPVFPSRVFRHGSLFVNAAAGITAPADLRGRRLGVPEYAQTANVWVRALLQHEYGVRPEEIHWVRGSTEKIDFTLPPGVRVDDAPPGSDLSAMLEAGEIDALAAPEKPASFLAGSPRVRRLFPNFAEVEADYYRRTGHFPIMHLVVLQRALYEAERTLPRRLYAAFEAAKQRAYEGLLRSGILLTSLAFQTAYAERERGLLGDDPFAYGLARARATVEVLAQYVYEQGLAPRRVALEELFAAETLDT